MDAESPNTREAIAGHSSMTHGIVRYLSVCRCAQVSNTKSYAYTWFRVVGASGRGRPVWCNKAAEVGESAKQGRCEWLLPQ